MTDEQKSTKKVKPTWPVCPVVNCGLQFTTMDELQEHMRTVHHTKAAAEASSTDITDLKKQMVAFTAEMKEREKAIADKEAKIAAQEKELAEKEALVDAQLGTAAVSGKTKNK